jgi:RimJ/RimL family protein N-acetyltransferase
MGGRSSGEREYALLIAELHALDEDIGAARAAARREAHPPGLELHAHHARTPPSGERVRLADGAEIVIRSAEPGDRHALDVGFARLSATSRLRQFRQPVEHLTGRQLTELTNVDHESHEALVAFDPASGECIGGARFVRAADDPSRAEFTCTVADRWQGRGVGTALVERLAARARAVGIDRFAAVMIVGDEPARRLLRRVGREVTEHREGGTVEIVGEARDPPPEPTPP